MKPYYGYSLLALPFLLGLCGLLSYWGDPSLLDHLLATLRMPRTYVALVLGENFIAWQLWYLMVLFYVYALVGAVYLKLRGNGLLVLFPILVVLSYLVDHFGSPLNAVFPMYANVVLNTLQFSLVFIIGIVIAKVFTDGRRTVVYWLALATLAFVLIGLWLFLPPLIFFLAICLLRNRRLLNRSYLLSRYSFQIYPFHLPIILFSVSIVLIVRYGMNNLLGLLLSVSATIVLCILAYKAAKLLRLNLLFESAERPPSPPKLTS